ncbi:hypothetical protein KAR91_62480 [Candidatus Pacearchaeota archaeon]|nr:hypothetical protein [Candidatus Pacearchaeota archaeon]
MSTPGYVLVERSMSDTRKAPICHLFADEDEIAAWLNHHYETEDGEGDILSRVGDNVNIYFAPTKVVTDYKWQIVERPRADLAEVCFTIYSKIENHEGKEDNSEFFVEYVLNNCEMLEEFYLWKMKKYQDQIKKEKKRT